MVKFMCFFTTVKIKVRTSFVVQWLRLHASTAGDTDLIPGQGTKVLHATLHGPPSPQKKKKGRKEKKNRHFIKHLDLFVKCSFLCDFPHSCGLDCSVHRRRGPAKLPVQLFVSFRETDSDNRHRIWHMPEF